MYRVPGIFWGHSVSFCSNLWTIDTLLRSFYGGHWGKWRFIPRYEAYQVGILVYLVAEVIENFVCNVIVLTILI